MWSGLLRMLHRLYGERERALEESERRAEVAERQADSLERQADSALERIRHRLRPLQSETDVGRHRWPESGA